MVKAAELKEFISNFMPNKEEMQGPKGIRLEAEAIERIFQPVEKEIPTSPVKVLSPTITKPSRPQSAQPSFFGNASFATSMTKVLMKDDQADEISMPTTTNVTTMYKGREDVTDEGIQSPTRPATAGSRKRRNQRVANKLHKVIPKEEFVNKYLDEYALASLIMKA